MKKETIQYFFLGILIAFTLAILIITGILTLAGDGEMIPTALIWQSLLLSVICSLVNMIYRSEKLKFIWRSIIAYFLTTAVITTYSMIGGWCSYGANNTDKIRILFILILIFSLCYFITWLFIWRIAKAREKELNTRLMEYKQRQ